MSRRQLTFIEVMIGAFLAVLIFAFFVLLPHGTSRETVNGVKCASNLRQIGQAMLLYANDNHGHYPRTIYTSGDNTIPTWGTGASATDPFKPTGPVNDVTASLFLLLRTQDITPEVFVCPSSDAEKWDFGGGANTAANWTNWNDWKKNLSYSFNSPFPNKSFVDEKGKYWTNEMPAGFAIASDLNPGKVNGEKALNVNSQSPASDMRKANSLNHDGDGQNVLFGDGHVEFTSNPLCGVNRDNIFLNQKNELVGPPMDFNDSILLPAATR